MRASGFGWRLIGGDVVCDRRVGGEDVLFSVVVGGPVDIRPSYRSGLKGINGKRKSGDGVYLCLWFIRR